MALQFRRGTEAERTQDGFTPLPGEPVYVTDTKRLYIGDGQTEGGNPVGFNNGLSDLTDVDLQSEVSIPILTINASDNQVRIATVQPHGLSTGDSIYVYSSTTPEVNGLHVVNVVGISTIVFQQTIENFSIRQDTGALKYEIADGTILAYDQATGRWGEQTYVYRLADLGDVKLNQPQNEEIIQYTQIPVGDITDEQDQIVESGVEQPETLAEGLTWTQTGSISKFINKPFEIGVANLNDVIINQSFLKNNQIIGYNSFLEIWTNRDYVDELEDLSDVSLNLPVAYNDDFRVKLSGAYAELDIARVTINGVSFEYTVTIADLDQAIADATNDGGSSLNPYLNSILATALADLINADQGLSVTATVDGQEIILVSDVQGEQFSFSVSVVDNATGDGYTPFIEKIEPTPDQILSYDGSQWTNQGFEFNNLNLNSLTDVDLDNAVDGQILQYDGIASQWKNVDNFISLSQFADVAVIDPQPGEALIYNPDNRQFETRDFILNDLIDVNDPSFIQYIPDGSILAYSEAEQKWTPQQFSSLASRTEVVFQTGPLENLEITTIDFEAFTGYALFKIQVSAPCTVTFYVSQYERLSDLAREENEAPIPGQGIFAELTPPDLTYRRIAPVIYGYNDDTPITRAAYVKVRNRSGYYQSNIVIRLTILQIEDDPVQF